MNLNGAKKKYALINLLLLAALIVVLFAWTLPVNGEVSELNEELRQEIAVKENLENRLDEIRGAGENLDSASEIERSRIFTAIPENLRQDQLIDQINNIARKNQVSISSISFGIPVGSEDSIKKATINISLSAEQKDLINFLKDIENNPRKLVVNSVTVQFSTVDDIDVINFNISMDAYYQEAI
ncbi:type 4a pilus biogenesis protein PilO [Candidatus Peregrinibacteria bacterium]|nr:type 4a pilus biogenesis protein PilO [Candidatus Peregrinibacteria bacterium]